MTFTVTKLLSLAFGKDRATDIPPSLEEYESVVSQFQIQTLAEACRVLGENGYPITTECFYRFGFQAKNMPFELDISVKFNNMELYIYTEGAEIGGEKIDIRFERESYSDLERPGDLEELQSDFLKELKRFL